MKPAAILVSVEVIEDFINRKAGDIINLDSKTAGELVKKGLAKYSSGKEDNPNETQSGEENTTKKKKNKK